jgi:hypothetical protein
MATTHATPTRAADGRAHHDRGAIRRTTETKAAFKTTELIGYMISRGLAKSGSRDPHIEPTDRH